MAHCAWFQYKGIKTLRVTDYTSLRYPKSVADGRSGPTTRPDFRHAIFHFEHVNIPLYNINFSISAPCLSEIVPYLFSAYATGQSLEYYTRQNQTLAYLYKI